MMPEQIKNIKTLEFNTNPNNILGIKSGILWADEGHDFYPLLYISKPKSIDEEVYRWMLEHLKLSVEYDKNLRV